MSKLVDLLDEDKPIAEQKFVCLSFVSPEYEIKNKNLFFFKNFVYFYPQSLLRIQLQQL